MSDRTNFEETPAELASHSPQVRAAVAAAIPAGFWRRFLATLIDAAALTVIQYPIKIIGDMQGSTDTIIWLIYTGAFGFLIAFIYAGFFLTAYQATPGKIVMSMKIIKADGKALDFKTIFIREILGKSVSSILLGFGYLMAGFRHDKKALHDLMAETQVILVDKKVL